MSAIIAAEFAATEYRGTMMAAVFAAQSMGRLLAYIIGFTALRGIIKDHHLGLDDPSDQAKIPIDILWRLVVGLAGVPAILAIGLRLRIPETPRFFSAVKRDLKKAHESASRVSRRALRSDEESISDFGSDEPKKKEELSWGKTFGKYMFGDEQGSKKLIVVSLLWLLLDFAFYGTGLDSPSTLSTLWVDRDPPPSAGTAGLGSWNEDVANPNATIARTISANAERSLELSSAAALAGSLAIIPLINLVDRRKLLTWTSAILAVLFLVTAFCVRYLYATPGHVASMVFYAIAQFVFNLGPNTLIFILAAEIFPTEFRGTCYGIAAASGKIGAVLVRPAIEKGADSPYGLSNMLFVFFAVMVVMTLITIFAPLGLEIPRVQVEDQNAELRCLGLGNLKTLTLEEIAPWPVADKKLGGKEASGLETSPAGFVDSGHVNGIGPFDGGSPYITVSEAAEGSGAALPPPAMELETVLNGRQRM
jgi:MFS transporter, PHS family, inorganic phosphate transporter